MYTVYTHLEWILTPDISTAMYKTFRQNSDIHVHMNIGHKKLANWKKKIFVVINKKKNA